MAKTAIPTLNLIDYSSACIDPFFQKFIEDRKGGSHYNLCEYLQTNNIQPHYKVVQNLQTGKSFSSSDIKDLEGFTKNINKYVRITNWINNFKQKNIDLPTLFNEIADSNSFNDFEKKTTQKSKLIDNLEKAIPSLFSIIKHCQNSDKYPINYLQWRKLNEHCQWSIKGSNEYDRLCHLYNDVSIPHTDTPKHVYFAAYIDYLAHQLLKLITPSIKDYSERSLKDLFNTYKNEIDKLLHPKPNSTPNSLPSTSAFPQPEAETATEEKSSTSHPLNLILYGPPGTGKTYNTLFHALEIINGKEWINKTSDDYDKLKQEFDRLVSEGQIVFTTFHQSMSYEDFIEGIKPITDDSNIIAVHKNDKTKSSATQFGDGTTTIDKFSRMKYEVRPGIFKKICQEAEKNRQESDVKNSKIINVQKLLNAFCDDAEANNRSIHLIKNGKEWYEIIPQRDDNAERDVKSFVINYGSKQHLTRSIIERDWENYKNKKIKSPDDIKPTRGNQSRHGNALYYYCLYKTLEKFEGKYKPEQIKVDLQNYVLIIDEINRGNVSQIFGELITLIEKDKRLGEKEQLTVQLPYSSSINPEAESFGVPNNLYIIGTMNTADRSVEALDTALRRRFSFKEMMPQPELLKTITLKDKKGNNIEINLTELLKKINNRIILLKDREHQIGHSYFMGHEKYKDKNKWLQDVFMDKIIPLLQEYFYGDYKKIYYVLDEGFVKIATEKKEDVFSVRIEDDFDVEDNTKRYEIRSYYEIEDIVEAINKLMGRKKNEDNNSTSGADALSGGDIEGGSTSKTERVIEGK